MYKWIFSQIMRQEQIAKFLVSGVIAATVNLSLLYTFTDIFHLWYIASSWIAFIITFFVSFALQRYWTFNNREQHLIRRQIIMYFAVAIMNVGINTALIYALVEYFQLHYLVAQFIALGLISIESFFVYKRVIFGR